MEHIRTSLKNWNRSTALCSFLSCFDSSDASAEPSLSPSHCAVSETALNAETSGVPESTQRAAACAKERERVLDDDKFTPTKHLTPPPHHSSRRRDKNTNTAERRDVGCARKHPAGGSLREGTRADSDMCAPLMVKGCEEKHSHTAAHHPVVKHPAVVSTAVSHTPTQQQGWGNDQELTCSLS